MTVGVSGGGPTRLKGEEALDDPVFERVEREDRESTAGGQQVDRRWEEALQLPQLVVDEDPNRLKGAGCRVDTRSTLRSDGLGDGLGEAESVRPWATAHDGSGDPPGATLLPITRDDVADLIFFKEIDHIEGRELGVGIHAHVDGAIVAKAEATSRGVELGAAHPEIGEDAVDLGKAKLRHHLRQPRERSSDRQKAIPKAGETMGGRLDRRGITVQTDDATVRGLEQGLGVPSSPEGAVHKDLSAGRGEGLNHLVAQDRDVLEGGHG